MPAVPVDGTVERVAVRVFAITAPLPGARRTVAEAAERLGLDPAAQARPADFTQALFDLGATVCTPRAPACVLCPWQGPCAARAQGIAAELPRKTPRAIRPLRHGAQFWLTDEAGQVLLRRRPPNGLLGGMLELPGAPWRTDTWAEADALAHAPQPAVWRLTGVAEHGFTHFQLRMDVYAARVPAITAPGLLRPVSALETEALPTVMRRCIAVARQG